MLNSRDVYLLGGKLRDTMYEPKAMAIIGGYDSLGVSAGRFFGVVRPVVVVIDITDTRVYLFNI